MLLLLLLSTPSLATPLEPGQPGGPWSEQEVAVAQEKVRAMLACSTSCWLSHPIASLLAEGELDDYSRPHEEATSGPRYARAGVKTDIL